jgi:hypothetical protein
MLDLTVATMVDITAATTAWVTTVAIAERATIGAAIAEQSTIAADTAMRETGTMVIVALAIIADTAVTILTIGVSGMAVGTLTASARAGVGRTTTMNSFGSATEAG